MLSKMWGWIVAAGAVLVAILFFVIGQRDRAKAKLKEARVQQATVEATQEVERATTKAQAHAREQANDLRREREERPSDERPDGDFRR